MENFSLEYLGLIVTIGDCARQVNCWDLASLPKQSGMKRDRSHDRQVLNKNPGWKWKIHRNIRTQTVYGPTSWHSFTYHGHVNTAFLCIVGPRLCQTCCRVPSHPIVTDAHMFPFSWRYSSALLNLAQQWQKKKNPIWPLSFSAWLATLTWLLQPLSAKVTVWVSLRGQAKKTTHTLLRRGHLVAPSALL